MPRHQHNCKECVFLGEDGPRSTKEGSGYVDLYYHPGWRAGIGYLTRRWGDDPYKDKEECSIEKWHRLIDAGEREANRWNPVVTYAKKKGLMS